MMKKNNSQGLSESDELYALIHDFLKNDDGGDSCTGLYKGLAYALPAAGQTEAYVRVRDARLSLGSRSVELGGEVPNLFLPAGGECPPLELAVGTVVSGEEEYDILQAVFHVYREGTPAPVASATWEGDEYGGISLSFLPDGGGFLPGNYFLLCERVREYADEPRAAVLNSHLCYPFRLLQAGEGLEHPGLVSADACRPAGLLEEGGYTSGLLRLVLRLDRTVPGRCEFGAACYTQDWNPMAETLRYVANGRGRRLSFNLHTDRIWVPGEYFVVVSQNGEPFAKVVFRYDGKETSPGRCCLLGESDSEYGLVKHVAASDENRWRMVHACPGLSAVKPRLAGSCGQGHFNSLCDSCGLEMLKQSQYRVVLSDELFPAKRLAYVLPPLAGLGTSGSKLVDCAEWTASPDAAKNALDERGGQAFALYGLPALCTGDGAAALERLVEAACDPSVFWVLILCGSREEVDALFRRAPGLSGCFAGNEPLEVLPLSGGEQVHLLQGCLKDTPFRLSPGAEHALAVQVTGHREEVRKWKKADMERFISTGIVPRLKARLQAEYVPGQGKTREELVTIRPADIDLEGYLHSAKRTKEAAPANAFAQSMQELNALVGLGTLKESLAATFLHTRFEEERRRMGLPVEGGGCHHMIFTGNPGTGKSTVAALIGKVYHAMGLLSRGGVVSTERGKLVGRYIGETEEKVNEVLKQARGNVLFIDEAYSLCDSADDRKDYGNRVVESLLTVLAQPHPDMLVILAGYADEMERLLQMNPGLESRFPHRFHFDDYTAEELLQIARDLLQRQQYLCEPDADRALDEVVRRAVAGKDRYFGNARWVVQLVATGILPAMAWRVMREGKPLDREALCTIRREDVERAAGKCSARPALFLAPRRRIGFTA